MKYFFQGSFEQAKQRKAAGNQHAGKQAKETGLQPRARNQVWRYGLAALESSHDRAW